MRYKFTPKGGLFPLSSLRRNDSYPKGARVQPREVGWLYVIVMELSFGLVFLISPACYLLLVITLLLLDLEPSSMVTFLGMHMGTGCILGIHILYIITLCPNFAQWRFRLGKINLLGVVYYVNCIKCPRGF